MVDSFDPASAKPEAVTLPVTLFYARCMDHLELVWSESLHGFPWQARAYRYHPMPRATR